MALGKTGGVPSAVPKPGESLADLFPDVAAQWHPTRNGELTPTKISYGVGRRYWWKCDVADDSLTVHTVVGNTLGNFAIMKLKLKLKHGRS